MDRPDDSARRRLQQRLSGIAVGDWEAALNRARVASLLLPRLGSPDFVRIDAGSLTLAAGEYDRTVFGGLLGTALENERAEIRYGFNRRLSSTGARLSARHLPDGRRRFTLEISVRLLFANFVPGRPGPVGVNGLAASHRLDALLLLLEHELVHLAEMLAWRRSSCGQPRFKRLARSWFGHPGTKHELLPQPVPAPSPTVVRPGMRVVFVHAGRRHTGTVTRITRRATVMVDPARSGDRPRRYYVPLALLAPEGGPADRI